MLTICVMLAMPNETQAQWFRRYPMQPKPQQPTPQLQPQQPKQTPKPLPKCDGQIGAEVRVTAGNSMGTGTVFFRDNENGSVYVLTNYHVAGPKNSRCGVEFWCEGQLLPARPGVVVEAQIDEGYVDVAVVRITQDNLPGDNISVIPVADPATSVATQITVTSRGSPGGTWQTLFMGRTFDVNPKRFQFYPRPGGGRSGSSIVVDGRIVGLLTWSSGKPDHENHSVDGFGYQSGYGIAQQVSSIWRVLKQQTSMEDEVRPDHFKPLVAYRYETEGWSGDPRTAPVAQLPRAELNHDQGYAAFGVQVDPEEEARLRKRRQQGGEPLPDFSKYSEEEGDQSGVLRNRNEPGPIRKGLRTIAMFAIVIAGLVVMVLYIGKRKGWWAIGFLLVGLSGPACGCAQDMSAYNAEMKRLAASWNVETVSQETRWGSYKAAFDKQQETHQPMVVLVTMDACPACDQLKAQLRHVDQFGWLNQSLCAVVNSTQEPEMAERLTSGPNGDRINSYPVLFLIVPVPNEDGTWTYMRHRHVGTFPTQEDVDRMKALEDESFPDGPQTLIAQPCPITLEEFLVGAGVK